MIALLIAQNIYFNAAVSPTSPLWVVFSANYKLLAAMGTLLKSLKPPPPVDAAPLDVIPFAVFPYTLPTLRVFLPQTGSEPLLVPVPTAGVSARPVVALAAAEPQGQDGFKDRWPQWSFASMMPPGVAESFALRKARSAAD